MKVRHFTTFPYWYERNMAPRVYKKFNNMNTTLENKICTAFTKRRHL